MLESKMQEIKNCIEYLRNYFLEDKEAKKVFYL